MPLDIESDPSTHNFSKIDEDIEFIKQNPNMTNLAIGRELGISASAVSRRRSKINNKTVSHSPKQEQLLSELATAMEEYTEQTEETTRLRKIINGLVKKIYESNHAS